MKKKLKSFDKLLKLYTSYIEIYENSIGFVFKKQFLVKIELNKLSTLDIKNIKSKNYVNNLVYKKQEKFSKIEENKGMKLFKGIT